MPAPQLVTPGSSTVPLPDNRPLDENSPSALARAVEELSRTGVPLPYQPPSPEQPSENEESEPELSDPGVIASSPIRGTKEERAAARNRKSQRKRRHTNELKKEQLAAAQAELKRERLHEEARRRALALKRLQNACLAALAVLDEASIPLGDFLLFVLDPDVVVDNLAVRRWEGLLRSTRYLDQILGFWSSTPSTPLSVRKRVQQWMVDAVSDLAALEARRLTSRGLLRVQAADMNVETVLGFDFTVLHGVLREQIPIMVQVSESFATSRKQQKANSDHIMRRKKLVVSQSLAGLLREHSRLNNIVANHNSLYLYASGAQRQTITMLSHLGIASSYTTLVRKSRPRDPMLADSNDTDSHLIDASKSEEVVSGILPALSESCMQQARDLAATSEYSDTYDNLNVMNKVAEQIMGRKDALESGTTSALARLFKVTANSLSAQAADAAFLAADILHITDLLFSRTEAADWYDLNEETICWIAIHYGGDDLLRFESALERTAKKDPYQIELHKSEIYPLQTMEIDESSITGNVDVVNAIHEQLGLIPDSPGFLQSVRLFFGDQLTVARQRAIISARAGHERGAESWQWAKPIAGLFHTDMAAVTCTLNTHYGRPDSGARNPASLWFHNTALDRKPIVLSSLPPYRVCRDLVFVSLYARVLHCLLRVSQTEDLAAFGRSITSLRQLRGYAKDVLNTYASAKTVASLRFDGLNGQIGPVGDDVFENASLFLRDALALRTFSLLVKSGRSGHILLGIKWLALSFKSGGHPKYAREMLYVVHNMEKVWPKPLRDLILNNWLVNPTGTEKGWIALDLMQEHLNFWIKRIYTAHGSNASWDWLKTISPCVNALRKLANQVHATLGSYQGRKHQSPGLARDIDVLMQSLTTHRVYEIQLGRHIDGEEPVPDLQALGAQQMMSGPHATLREFNSEFRTLQARSRVKPLQPFEESVATAAGTTTEAVEAAAAAQFAVNGTGGTAEMQGDPSDNGSAGSESSSESEEFDVDSELDELFLSLEDEADVSLDPDMDWAEEESSGDEDADFDDGCD